MFGRLLLEEKIKVQVLENYFLQKAGRSHLPKHTKP
jgi:hypothetical protein